MFFLVAYLLRLARIVGMRIGYKATTRWLLCFSLCLVATVTYGQFEPEQVLEKEEDVSESSEIAEVLANLRAHPLDINRATVAELQQLPWLSPLLAAKIVAFRRAHGRIQVLDELLEIPEMDESLLETIADYLIVVPPVPSPWQAELRLRGSTRLERSRGFQTGAFPGSPIKTYARLRWGLGSAIQGGGLLEKDPGEQRFDDYANFFLQVSLPYAATRIVLGHYQLEFGQGLVMWSPYGHGKGSDPGATAVRKARGLRPYSSAAEYGGLRGLAVESSIGSLALTAFGSNLPLDATIDAQGQVTSFDQTGYHRTPTERAKRQAVTSDAVGGRLGYGVGRFKAGVTWYGERYSRPVNPPDSLRRRFAFRGTRHHVAGADLSFNLPSALLFAEAARSSGEGKALVCGLLLELPRVKLVAHYRDYDPDFFNPYALPFASSTGVTANERGFYLGGQWHPRGGTRLSFYFDTYKMPWRTYHVPVPAEGEDGLLQLEKRLLRGTLGLFRLRYARRTELTKTLDLWSREVDVVAEQTRLYVRLQAQLDASEHVSLRGRLEKSHVLSAPRGLTPWPKKESAGILLSQDLTVKLRRRWQCQFRFLVFDTDDYDARIYAYEGDLPGVLTNRGFSGRGSHWYVLLRARVAGKSSLGVKLSSTHYDDRATVGSGLDVTEGPSARSLSAQLDVGG
ncbi:MAG: helix-hairpin-helix domain-containing protein [candidate division KSB1 bacterium]|nr:helix-hairpin-helix domain-containing protein [candidate division KSB1 bacterium]